MNYAVINEENLVINVISWDGISQYNPGAGLSLIQSESASIGDTYNGVEIVKKSQDPETSEEENQ